MWEVESLHEGGEISYKTLEALLEMNLLKRVPIVLGGLSHPFFIESRYKGLKDGEALRTHPIIQFQTFSIW